MTICEKSDIIECYFGGDREKFNRMKLYDGTYGRAYKDDEQFYTNGKTIIPRTYTDKMYSYDKGVEFLKYWESIYGFDFKNEISIWLGLPLTAFDALVNNRPFEIKDTEHMVKVLIYQKHFGDFLEWHTEVYDA